MPKAEKAAAGAGKAAATGPKKPLTSYMHFAAYYREVLKREKPELAQKDIIKAIGEKWNSLSAPEKKVYEDRAAADKERYVAEGGKPSKASKKASGEGKGANGYALFLKEMRPVVLKKQPDLPFADIGRKVAELWKSISDAEKEKYKAKAKALNAAKE